MPKQLRRCKSSQQRESAKIFLGSRAKLQLQRGLPVNGRIDGRTDVGSQQRVAAAKFYGSYDALVLSRLVFVHVWCVVPNLTVADDVINCLQHTERVLSLSLSP